MFTRDERKALASLERSERFRQRAKWLLLVSAVAVMASAAHIFVLDLRLLPEKGESAAAEVAVIAAIFWPTFFMAAGFWIAGLYLFVKAITWWRGDPSNVLLIALAREWQSKHQTTTQTGPETQSPVAGA